MNCKLITKMKLLNKQIKFLLPVLLFLSPLTASADKDAIWNDGNNIYFKYDNQKITSTEKNSHPIELNAEEIVTVARLLNIRKKEVEPVFTEQQAKLLGKNLANGLKHAQPDQDIIFVMEKTISNSRSTLFKGRQYFVAGRVFYQNDKLNIIIGDYDRIRDRAYEAAVDPTNVGVVNYNFDHGRRATKSKGLKYSIIPADGIEQKKMQGKNRDDWLVIDLKTAITTHTQQAKAQKEEEMIQKRKELEKILGVGKTKSVMETDTETEKVEHPAGHKQPQGHKQARPTPAVKTGHSVEERLTTLNQLKSKGLITEQEYTQKRQQILDEL